ncbi:nitrate regulatory protein [Zobellella iuensis]|uniref:Nitrate- and nitrite sensing domain-containing protein n=1 Tax=Zobellella iuensis TaxID=2803811 RepID=A0ABS1QXF1_9GAMM|nr:nitrate regulatory protein [Zobellella iuensis]MBL1379542.1 nitrate- and nitrite sensing domain-containing protein [Zobellella iuensis]
MAETSAGRPDATDYLIASKECEIQILEQLLRMGQLVVCISHLVHTLQRERGASNMYLGSRGERFGSELQTIRRDSDQHTEQFHQALAALNLRQNTVQAGSRLLNRIGYAVHILSDMERLRDEVGRQAIQAEAATRVYTELVQGLLAVVFEAADAAVDPDIARLLVAMFHFMQGKELTGQERAAGAAAFASGHGGGEVSPRIQHLIEAQERCFEVFAGFVDPASWAVWRQCQQDTGLIEVERLRRLLCTSNERTAFDPRLGQRWFEAMSGRIDTMQQVELCLAARLEVLCSGKLSAARDSLAQHCSVIDLLPRFQQGQDDAFVVFCSTRTTVEHELTGADCYHHLSPQLGRSLIELLQSQSCRLQQMQDELNNARAALEERKVVERAKGLLMTHRRLSEEEAHKLLRRTSMEQGRRQLDVARELIALAEMWT